MLSHSPWFKPRAGILQAPNSHQDLPTSSADYSYRKSLGDLSCYRTARGLNHGLELCHCHGKNAFVAFAYSNMDSCRVVNKSKNAIAYS